MNAQWTGVIKKHYKLRTKNLSLVPYHRQFVQEYHSWFSTDPELLYLTGSEPLTLEQQLQNHKSWLEDTRKYTFIIFTNSTNQMIGDINLFFSQWIQNNEAEINVMIAVKDQRGKGYAREAIEAVQLFALAVYARNTIIAKIKDDNLGSIKLFEKLGYKFIQDNHHYNEKQYRKTMMESKQQARLKLQNEYGMQQITQVKELYK